MERLSPALFHTTGVHSRIHTRSTATGPDTTLPEFLRGWNAASTLSRTPAPAGTVQGTKPETKMSLGELSWNPELRRTARSSRTRTHRRDPRREHSDADPRPAPVSLCVLALRYCRSFLTARSRTPFSLEASRWANWSSADCMAGAIAPAPASPGLRACRSRPSCPVLRLRTGQRRAGDGVTDAPLVARPGSPRGCGASRRCSRGCLATSCGWSEFWAVGVEVSGGQVPARKPPTAGWTQSRVLSTASKAPSGERRPCDLHSLRVCRAPRALLGRTETDP